jgi:two-component system, NtrC family, nitrogen regulation response regulator GlnG
LRSDARVIAATDANLEEKVASGTFRAPLLNRLAAYEIWIPPLRERREDIGRILAVFLREEVAKIGRQDALRPPAGPAKPWFPASLAARLCDHDWPGNVRELRNVARKLVVHNRERAQVEVPPEVSQRHAAGLEPYDIDPPAEQEPRGASQPPQAASESGSPDEPPQTGPAAARKPADLTEQQLDEALRACRWDFAAAAARLGISRASIYVLIERHPRFRTAGTVSAEEIRRCHRECGGDVARMADRLEVSERALARRVRELGLR